MYARASIRPPPTRQTCRAATFGASGFPARTSCGSPAITCRTRRPVYYTSGFDRACVVTVDGIGEWDCMTVGVFTREGYRPLRRTRYPHSIGLLYSAFTRRCGFKANEEEYIVMGLAGFGSPRHADAVYDEFLSRRPGDYRLKHNIHRGIGQWLPAAAPEDLAASIQAVTEDLVLDIARWARSESGCCELVLMGGVALNCVANSRIARDSGFDQVYIFPNPGDAGSSLGAAAAFVGKQLRWDGPYLGASIDRPYQRDQILDRLTDGDVVGIANGRAEFGPRALGNRSLLCDPRGPDVKKRSIGSRDESHSARSRPLCWPSTLTVTSTCRYRSRPTCSSWRRAVGRICSRPSRMWTVRAGCRP